MAQPTSPLPTLAAVAIPKQSTTAPSVEAAVTTVAIEHPRDRYFSSLAEQGKLQPEGRLVKSSKLILPRDCFSGAVEFFRTNNFVLNLLHYFSGSMKGTEILLTKGAFYVVGRNGWEQILQGNLQIGQTPEDLWLFCTQRPREIEIHFRLPGSFPTEQIETFQDLCLYFYILQVDYPQEKRSFGLEMTECAALFKEDVKLTDRMSAIRETILRLRDNQACRLENAGNAEMKATVRIGNFKIVLSYTDPDSSTPFQCDNMKLRLSYSNDNPVVEMMYNVPFPLESLHDHLIHRLVPVSFDKSALGMFWAHMTLLGRPFTDSETDRQFGRLIDQKRDSLPVWLALVCMEGLAHIPHYHDCLLAYHWNAYLHLAAYQVSAQLPPPPEVKNGGISHLTPFAGFLQRYVNIFNAAGKEVFAVLTVVASLRRFCKSQSESPGSRTTHCNGQNLIEISWQGPSGPLFLLVPANLEESLQLLDRWLQGNPHFASTVLSDALTVFFPGLDLEAHHRGVVNPALEPYAERIYQTLLAGQNREAAFLWHACACLAGWKSVNQDDILGLSQWCEVMDRALVVGTLSQVYQGTSHAPLFNAIRDRWLAASDPQSSTVSNICHEVMVLSDEEQAMRKAWADLSIRNFDFMWKICSRLSGRALTFALGSLCELCNSAKSSLTHHQQAKLLQAYLTPLKGCAQNREILPYVQKLVENARLLAASDSTQHGMGHLVTEYSSLAELLTDGPKERRRDAAPAVEKTPDPAPVAKPLREKKVKKKKPQPPVTPPVTPLVAPSVDTAPEPVAALVAAPEPVDAAAVQLEEALKNQNRKEVWAVLQNIAVTAENRPKVWSLIIHFQRLQQASSQTWNQFSEMALIVGRVFQGLRGQVSGIGTLIEWVASGLSTQNLHREVYALLRHAPRVKNDKVVSKWVQSCFNHLPGSKATLDEMLAVLGQVRETRDHEHLSSPVLLRLLEALLEAARRDGKSKDEKVHKEARLLTTCLMPSYESVHKLNDKTDPAGAARAEAVRFFTCLASYYAVLAESRRAVELIENLTENFSALKARKEVCVDDLAYAASNLLRSTPRDAHGWSKFAALFEKLKSDAAYSEAVVTILESLAAGGFLAQCSVKDAPFELFKKLAAFEKKLPEPEKVKLARALAAVLNRASQEKKEAEFIGSSIDWVLSLLQRVETWETYARLFFYQAGKNKEKSTPAFSAGVLWLAKLILISNDAQLQQLRPLIARISSADMKPNAAEWRRELAGVVARSPLDQTASALIKRMVELSDGEEKIFFEKSQKRYATREHIVLQRDLESYYASGSVPKPAPVAVVPAESPAAAAASAPPLEAEPSAPPLMSDTEVKALSASSGQDALRRAIIALETERNANFELWSTLWSFVTMDSPFFEQIWNAWLASHPIENVRPGDGKYWLEAINRCLTGQRKRVAIFDVFFKTQLIPLLARLEPEEARTICLLMVNMAITYSWRNAHDIAARLQTIYDVAGHETVVTKVGDSIRGMEPGTQFRYALLLGQQKSPVLKDHGESLLIDCIRGVTPAQIKETQNEVFFRNYSLRPVIPADPQNQETVYKWITGSLETIVLSWDEAAWLFQALCLFTLPTRDATGFNLALDIFAKWEDFIGRVPRAPPLDPLTSMLEATRGRMLATSSIEEQVLREVSQGPTTPFLFATAAVINFAMQGKTAFIRFATLRAIGRSLAQFEAKFFSNGQYTDALVRLWARYIYLAFEGIDLRQPLSVELVKDGLAIFKKCLPLLRFVWMLPAGPDGPEQELQELCVAAVTGFTTAIPSILKVGMADFETVKTLMEVMDQLMGTSFIVNGRKNVYRWESMLINTVFSVPDVCKSQANGKKIVQAIAKLLARSCCLPYVREQKLLKTEDHEAVLQESGAVLADFLTFLEVECLEVKDWNDLFVAVPRATALNMVKDLLQNQDQADCLGLVRIIRFSQAYDADFLNQMYKLLMEIDRTKIAPFDKDNYPLIQLQFRWHIVLAMSSMVEKLAQSKQFAHKKDELISALRSEQRKVILDFIRLAVLGVVDEESYKVYSRILVDVMNHADLPVLEFILEGFIFSADNPMAKQLGGMKAMIASRVANLKKPS